jgi:hypothetical protein
MKAARVARVKGNRVRLQNTETLKVGKWLNLATRPKSHLQTIATLQEVPFNTKTTKAELINRIKES